MGNPIRFALWFCLIMTSLTWHQAYADCMAPLGVAGTIRHMDFASNGYKNLYVCNGTQWNSVEVANTGTGCTSTGQIIYNGTTDRLEVCSSSGVATYNWFHLKGTATGSSCPAADEGKIQYQPAQGRFSFCSNTSYYYGGNLPGVLTTAPAAPSYNCVIHSMGGDYVTITLSNTGESTISGVSSVVGGPDAAGYPITSNTCGSTLAPAGSCEIQISYGMVLQGNPNHFNVTVSSSNGGPSSLIEYEIYHHNDSCAAPY